MFIRDGLYEATIDLPPKQEIYSTPMEQTQGSVLDCRIALVPIMRAGLGMVDSARELVPHASVYHLGIYRDELTHHPVSYYRKLPDVLPFDLTLETTDDLTPELIDQLELLAPDVLRDAATQIFDSLPPGGAAALPADVPAAPPADIQAPALQQGEASDDSAARADHGAATGPSLIYIPQPTRTE